MLVNDRSVSVLENYDFEVIRTQKSRNAILCETNKGWYILKEYKGPVFRLEMMAKVLEGKILQHQSKNFYRKCIENKLGLNDVDKVMGGVNFCLGLSRENDVFVPSSALLEDIKKLTSSPSQVLAIFEKDIDSELYSTVKHVAKGLNLHHLILPPEISSKISLEHYVYRGK